MSRYVAVLFFVIFAVVIAYDPVHNYYPGGGGHPHDGGTGGDPHHTGTGGDPHHTGTGGDPHYGGQGQPPQYGYDYYQNYCPCSKPHKKIDFVFVIKLVTKNYKPPNHRRHGFVSIHTDVLTVCQNDKKKKPSRSRGSSQPMARLETLKNVGAGCGPFDRMKEGECYIVRGYTTKPSRYRYFNIDQCDPPERVHCGYATCPHY
ncbi:Hypothetical predicted protein [Mytilus galloprovincialis]|uniref:Uncharacterized protein n=1 Tax=Mytilus galloprovincialis TaxID=29158 RepID=A0A8B6DU77_MYTGA|nr:Hypothetical predicted protein [Mytilus galloprovincialis]